MTCKEKAIGYTIAGIWYYGGILTGAAVLTFAAVIAPPLYIIDLMLGGD